MDSRMFSLVSCTLPFREGWRPVHNGTPTLAEWRAACFHSFLALCHSARVGVPCTTGRQPSQNGQPHVFPCFSQAILHRCVHSIAADLRCTPSPHGVSSHCHSTVEKKRVYLIRVPVYPAILSTPVLLLLVLSIRSAFRPFFSSFFLLLLLLLLLLLQP